MGEINGIGGISLSMFLGLAMITLKLWQLAELPMLLLLTGQVLLMFLYTYFVVFRVMGKDYDAAVICSGTCGFGMGLHRMRWQICRQCVKNMCRL